MSAETLTIFRLVIAGINGLLFTLGIALLLDVVVRKPARLKRELRHSIARAEQLDLAGDEQAAEFRKQVDLLKQQLKEHYNSPRSLLKIAFSLLMIILALLALVSLISPPFQAFSG